MSEGGKGGGGDGLSMSLIFLGRHDEVDAKFGEFVGED
jgi:hypothetical protein